MTELLPQQLLEDAERKQRTAADPAVSAWVRANAGTGKTHVLVQRILRLLLSGANPRSILCLTFTKNAAAEMETRVLARLGEWATTGEDALSSNLAKLLGRPPKDGERAAAPCLFASVIDAPGGLAIMTIHGFCERVLRRYSLEANVPPGFTVLTEEEARDALSEAQAQAFASAKSGLLRDAFTTVVAYAREDDFSRVLEAMLGHRSEIAHLMQVSSEEDRFQYVEERLRRLFDAADEDTKENLLARSASLLAERALKELVAILFEGSKKDQEAAAQFQAVAEARDAVGKHSALKAAFTTTAGEPRKSLMTAAIRQQQPALHDRLVNAQTAFAVLDEQICGLKVVEATMALLRLTVAIFDRYEAEKRARAAVDFDDLIDKTLSLLSREDAADWVLYQLDGRIDHILVDEAQDTSPEQWEIIERLTSDFFSGQGARSSVPTLFAVGDEKQSIYGFQGAAPKLLAENGASYEEKIQQAGFRWRNVDLNLSFRTLAPILAAVDSVIGALPSLRNGSAAPHVAYRRSGAGLVELWEPERGEKEDKGTVWEPDAATPRTKPAEALAARIASKIKHWLENGEALSSRERPIEPGDILILLRKRQPMAGLLQAALKRQGVPVSGADRMALLDELAVMDLMSLASALLQPDDDLALAEVLKSPLFSFTDNDLFELTFGRDASLWQTLDSTGAGADRYALATTKLTAWHDLAHQASPFDFFSHILEAEGGRKAFAARLGTECFDALDELLNLAEAFGARTPLSLSEFLVSLRRGASDVKRETDQGAREVRIMTVHGAKGLEADIVILADACSNRGASAAPVTFVPGIRGEGGGPDIPIWAVKGTSRLPAVAEAKNRLKDEEHWELGRLLYVAMTRARDRLYITGFHKGDLPDGCWYETIRSALASKMEERGDSSGRTVWRCGSPTQPQSPASTMQNAHKELLPPWLAVPAPGELALPILLPSRILGEARSVRSQERPEGCDSDQARARGVLLHRLLEVLPNLPAAERAGAAGAIAWAFSGEIPARDKDATIESAFAALSSHVFTGRGGQSLAEACIAVTLRERHGKRRGIITGQVDRILFDESEIHILDYKSGVAGLQTSFHAQLSAYRLALSQLYPAKNIHAALFNARSMALTRAEDTTLDAFIAQFVRTLPE